MAAINNYNPIDMRGYEVRNRAEHSLPAPPDNPKLAQTYWDSTLNKLGIWNGTSWDYLGTSEGTITDVVASAPITSSGGTTPSIGIAAASGSARGTQSPAHFTKLESVQEGATANDTDTALRARASHTGTQPLSTITGHDKAAHDALDINAATLGGQTLAQVRARSSHTGAQAISTVTGLQAALDAKIESSVVGANNGVASLGADGKIPDGQIPALALVDTFPVASQAAMLALTAERGDIAIRTDQSRTYVLRQEPASTLGNWSEIVSPASGVQSVGATAPIASTGGVNPTISIAAASGSVAGSMSAANFTKLGGIATGATANATDAALRARASHTGEQAISTVTGLQAALDAKGSGTVRKFTQTIGNGTLTNFTITHNLGTRDVTFTARLSASPYAGVTIDWAAATENTVTVSSAEPLANNELVVVVTG